MRSSRSRGPLALPLGVLALLFLRGAPLRPQTPRATRYDGGSTSHVRHETRPEFDASVPLTIEAWVYRERAGGCETMVSHDYEVSFWLGFCPKLRFYRSGGFFADAGVEVPAGHWTHVAASFDGAGVAFYLNGDAAGSAPLASAGAGPSRPILLGRDDAGGADHNGYHLQGSLDEVRLWRKPRSQAEVRDGMLHELRLHPDLIAAFPEGGAREALSGASGTAGSGAAESAFGILPRDLVVPRAAIAPSLDGNLFLASEYAGAEQLVIRYPDAGHPSSGGYLDATAYLVHTDEHLFIGVACVRDTTGGWPRAQSRIEVFVDPDGSRDALARPSDFQAQASLGSTPLSFLFGNGAGGWEPCGLKECPRTTQAHVASAFCCTEFGPPCFEFRIARSLLGDWSEIDGLAISHSWVGGPGNDYPGPPEAVWNSPATWAEVAYGEGSAALPKATFGGYVYEETASRPRAGHTLVLRDEDAGSLEIARTTSLSSLLSDNGFYRFDVRVPAGHRLALEALPCPEGCVFLRPVIASGPISPLTVTDSRIVFPGCALASRCIYPRIDFFVDTTPPPAPEPKVLGFEVNQAVQNTLFYPGGPGTLQTASSAIPLLPGKDTLVRYYLAAEGGALNGFSADLELTVFRADGTSFTRLVRPNAGVSAVDLPVEPGDEDGRLRLLYDLRYESGMGRTLNYVIPGPDLVEARRLQFVLKKSGALTGGVQVVLRDPVYLGLNVVRVLSSETGPAPGDPTIDSTILGYLKRAFPVSDVRVLSRRTWRWGGAYVLADDCDSIIFDVWYEFGGDDAPVVVPTTDPMFSSTLAVVSSITGCSGIAMVGDPGDEGDRIGGSAVSEPFGDVAAQEIGHTLGLIHASDDHGESDGGDAEPWSYPHGSLGSLHVPFRNFGNCGTVLEQTSPPAFPGDSGRWRSTLVDPCPVSDASQARYPDCQLPPDQLPHDIMSYGSSSSDLGPLVTLARNWVSDITYSRIYNAIRYRRVEPPLRGGGSVEEETGGGQAEDRVEAFLIAGRIARDGTVQLLPILQKPVPLAFVEGEEPGPYLLEIQDGDGRVLVDRTFNLRHLTLHTSEVHALREALPHAGGAKRLVIKEGDRVLHQLTASPSAPTVAITAPGGGEPFASGTQTVAWNASDADGDELTFLVQYSPDGGERWQGIALVPPGRPREAAFEVAELIPGQRGVIRVTATDGFNTSVDRTNGFFCVGACDTTQPPAPTGLAAAPGDRKVELDWDDQDPAGPFYRGYHVYRSLVPGGPYTRVSNPVLTESRYTDADPALQAGVRYCYVVRALGIPNVVSRQSNEACAAPADGPRFLRGDANADGTLDLSDAVFTFSHLFLGGAAPSCPDAADAGDEGGLSISSGIYLLGFLFTGGAAPRAPYPACGADATADGLGSCAYPEERCR